MASSKWAHTSWDRDVNILVETLRRTGVLAVPRWEAWRAPYGPMHITNRYPVSCTLWTNVFPEAWRAPNGPMPYNINWREVPCCCLTLGSSAPSSPTSSHVCVLFTGEWAALLRGQLLISPETRQLRLGDRQPPFCSSLQIPLHRTRARPCQLLSQRINHRQWKSCVPATLLFF